MRILCGLDPKYTGEVTVYEENLDREVGQGSEGATEGAVDKVPYISRNSTVEVAGNAREGFPRNSSSLLQRCPLMVESAVHSPRDNRGQDRSSSGPERNSYWRDVLLFFLKLSIQWSATARRFVNKRVDILFPPKGKRARRCVGWCSQEDALFEYLNVREHIELFESLLGDSEAINSSIPDTAASLDDLSIAEPDLGPFLLRKCKRILSFLMVDGQKDIRKSAQLLHLSRLGMAEHSEKMAMELSGKIMRLSWTGVSDLHLKCFI